MANWVKLNGTLPNTYPTSFSQNNSHLGYGWRGSANSTTWYFEYATDYPTCGGSSYTGTGYMNLATGTWNYLVATYDGTMIRSYMNGALVASIAGPGGGNMCAPSASNPLGIGINVSYAGVSYEVNDARLYNRVLSAQEIQAMYTGAL